MKRIATNILVTGGTGFISSHLIESLLRRGDQIRCIAKDRLNAVLLESLNVEVILGDLNNGIAWGRVLDGTDCIYHLAGITRAQWSGEYHRENHAATRLLLTICSRELTTLKRIIYLSGLAAVGPSLDGAPVTEESPCQPVSHYGKSKMMAEIEVLRARDRFPVTILRPAAVYGPRERDRYEYYKILKRGFPPLIGLKTKMINLVHVDDLIGGILLASDSPRAANEIYFMGSEECYSTEAIGNTVAGVIRSSPLRIRLSHALVYSVAAIAGAVGKCTGRQILFNIQKAREAIQPS